MLNYSVLLINKGKVTKILFWICSLGVSASYLLFFNLTTDSTLITNYFTKGSLNYLLYNIGTVNSIIILILAFILMFTLYSSISLLKVPFKIIK